MTAPLASPPAHPHRLAYLGTPEAAVPPLRALVEAGFEVALVVSRPDARRGRGGALGPSPVKAAALALGIPVTDRVDDVVGAGVDLGVVVAYGRLIRRPVLEAVPMVNVHFSLLPRWRGAAPVERALLAGDTETGACLMQLWEGLDTGPVYGCERVGIDPGATLGSLRQQLVDVGSRLLVRHLRQGLGTPAPQQGEATYAAKLDPAELHVDWSAPAVVIDRLVRLGGAWTTWRGRRLEVRAARAEAAAAGMPDPGTLDGTRVATGDGWLGLVEVQPEGRRALDAAAWRNGARPRPGERMGA